MFYQLKGSMLLRIVENNEFRDIHINESEAQASNPPRAALEYTWSALGSRYADIQSEPQMYPRTLQPCDTA